MDAKKFIFGRDLTGSRDSTRLKKRSPIAYELPETVELLTGCPLFVIFMDPPTMSNSERSYINLQYLIDEGIRTLELGSETPLIAGSRLKKLAMGLRMARDKGTESIDFQKVTKIGREESMKLVEQDFLMVAKWLTYFDEFQMLPRAMQITLLKSIWHVWTRLEKLSLTAASRRRNICCDTEMMLGKNSAYDQKTLEVDISWATKYPKEKLKFLFDEPHEWMDTSIIDPLTALEPTDIELVYMMCQLCFQYAGKRHQGEILTMTDRFQECLADELHVYYTNELKMIRYAPRVVQMMNINNLIQQDIRQKRIKNELAKVFQVFYTQLSHPEMFEDT